MPKRIGISGVTVFEEDSSGKVTRAETTGNLDVTADTFAVKCKMIDTTTGIEYYNAGSLASPAWQSIVQVKTVALTAAQIILMYTTAQEIIPAVPGKSIIVEDVIFDLTGTATQFTGGGVVGVQYKNTANGAGQLAHADIAASVVTGATAQIITRRRGGELSSIAIADIKSIGLYISNKTAVFAAGTGTANVTVKYRLI